MSEVFVDSGGFFAYLVLEDAAHERAVKAFDRVQTEGSSLVATNAVLFETHALILSRARDGRDLALRFLDSVLMGLCRVERVTRLDEQHALDLIRKQQDKAFSYCDALSFVVIERLGIEQAIAFDRHFRQYGRLTLL
ncbi:MAG: type II toxin-antitoxin system VapC family toxin [Micrococcales bacterium]|nr:type II toxin-antitoxin system VapC family toxin [Micrococcales bacterium]